MGKAEGSAENWHGHVTAVTVAPEYRRLGLAAKLMHSLEDISEKYVLVLDSIIFDRCAKYISTSDLHAGH